jgi:hypothetical protein
MLLAAALSAPARADHVGIVTGDPPVFAVNGVASGLLVAGRGPTVSRAEALDALEGLRRCRCEITIYLSLPDAPEANDRRFRVVVSGPGYEGLLISDRTRIPGLVSIYDIKPTVEALEEGTEPPLRSRPGRSDRARLAALERRLDEVDDSRMPAGLALVVVVAAFMLLAAWRRSALFGRSALLAVPVALGTALSLSALEIAKPWTAVPVLFVVTALGGLGLGWLLRDRSALAAALLAIFPLYLIVLAVSQETNSLAVIGPRPENGGRFYGFNNQLETLVLVPAFLGGALVGPLLLPAVAVLVLVTVGASFAGADGGGVVVLLAGFLFLWLRLRRVPLTVRNLALTAGAVVGLGLALVGIDAALGGESHVTRSLGGGPDQLADDVVDRLESSVRGIVSSWHATAVIAASVPVLVWLALRRPRYLVLDALLIAIAVSLLVNDAPREVSGFGALCALALRFWWEASEGVD